MAVLSAAAAIAGGAIASATVGGFAAAAAGAGLGLAAASSFQQFRAAEERAELQEESARKRQEQQRLKARRSRMQEIRKAQITRARANASAEAAGSSGSSGSAGGIRSISSRLGSGISFSNQMSGLSSEISSISGDLAQNRADTQRAQIFGSLGTSLFSAAGGLGSLGFGTQPQVNDLTARG